VVVFGTDMGSPEARVNQFVEGLLRDRRPPGWRLGAEELEAVAGAIRLHVVGQASPVPDACFVERLRRRLVAELERAQTT
jgi:hypothetical protein